MSLRLTIEYRAAPVFTPVSRFVHRPLDGAFHVATRFDPPMPGPVAGQGWPLWVLEHRGHTLFFASPEEMTHVADVLGQRVLPKPRRLGEALSAVNSHWLSRMDKAWLSWKVREEVAAKLRAALAR